MMDINVDLFQWSRKFFDKKNGSGVKNLNISHKALAEEFHKPVTRIFKKRKVYSSFIDNI